MFLLKCMDYQWQIRWQEMATGMGVKGLAEKFTKGELHNAEGAHLSRDVEGDRGLATNNHLRKDFQFLGFGARIIASKKDDEAASLALARRLQQEEEQAMQAVRQAEEEEASVRLALELSRRIY